MNVGNVAGAVGLAGQHPQLIRPFADHLRHRLSHPFTKHRNGRVHAPEQITIVVTDICNLRCKMCQYAYSDSPGYQLNQAGHMSPDLFYKILDEITGHPLITFTGGVKVGKMIADKAGYKRAALELGGNDPLIILNDLSGTDLEKAATSKAYADDLNGIAAKHGVTITELTTHLQGQLVAVHPAYDAAFDAFSPAAVHGNAKARAEWATDQMKKAARVSRAMGLVI